MADIGEIRRADEVGLKGFHKMIWLACQHCGKARWVVKARPSKACVPCTNQRIRGPRPAQSTRQRGAGNPMWRGGVVRGGNGYRYVLMEPTDPLHCMANRLGYAMEHRLVIARSEGRPLASWEQVHHRNGRRDDNRLENLELWKRSQPSGIRQADYHCPGCRCEEMSDG